MRGQILWYGLRAGLQASEAKVLFDEALKLAEEAGDPGGAAYALLGYGTYTLYGGQGPKAYPLFPRAVAEADRSGDVGLRIATRWGQANAEWFKGDLQSAFGTVEEGLELCARDSDAATVLLGYSALHFMSGLRGNLHAFAGRVQEAERDLEFALRAPDVIAHLSRGFAVQLWELTGDARVALAQARRAVAGVEESGATIAGVVFSHRTLGSAHALNGEWKEAIAALEHSLQVARDAQTFVHIEPETLVWLAQVLLEVGELDRARVTLDDAFAEGERLEVQLHAPHGHLVRARLLRHSNELDAAEASLGKTLETARAMGARFYEPFVHLERAELAQARGDDALRRSELEAAQSVFAEMGASARAEELARARGS